MTYFRRGRVWHCRFYINGIRSQFSTHTSNRRLAERIGQKRYEEVCAQLNGIAHYDSELSVGALMANFLAQAQPSTYQLERIKQLTPFFADIRMCDLTKSLTEEYRQQRLREDHVSDATVNRDLAVLRRICNWAVDQRLIPQHALVRVHFVRERRVRTPVLSVAEEQQLLAVAAPYLRRLIICALDTGMRKGELLAQRWEHVDLSRALLYVTRSKTPEGEGREIPLTKRVLALLSEQPQTNGLIFTYRGQAIKDVKKGWASALRDAGLRHIRFHDLRHCDATRLMEAGVIADIRMSLLGHSGGHRTHSIYTHVEVGAKRAAIAQLEAWLTKQQQLLGGNKENDDAKPQSA